MALLDQKLGTDGAVHSSGQGNNDSLFLGRLGVHRKNGLGALSRSGLTAAVLGLGVAFAAVLEGFFEFADTLAQTAADLRKPIGPEKEQADEEND